MNLRRVVFQFSVPLAVGFIIYLVTQVVIPSESQPIKAIVAIIGFSIALGLMLWGSKSVAEKSAISVAEEAQTDNDLNIEDTQIDSTEAEKISVADRAKAKGSINITKLGIFRK